MRMNFPSLNLMVLPRKILQPIDFNFMILLLFTYVHKRQK